MTAHSPETGRDPGLQPQRTALAWQRTAVSSLLLSLAALGASAHRLASSTGGTTQLRTLSLLATLVAVVAAVVAAVDAVVVVPRQVEGFARQPSPEPVPSSQPVPSPFWRLRLVAAATVLLALAGALLSAAGVLASVASSGA